MTEIAEQLRREVFKFIPLRIGEKIPLETEWQKNNYKYSDPHLTELLGRGYNVGLCCGFGNLVVIDADTKDFLEHLKEKLPETFTVKTPHGYHFYLFCSLSRPIICNVGSHHYGEVRNWGQQIVAPNSVVNGVEYRVVRDREIVDVEESELLRTIEKFVPKRREIVHDKLTIEKKPTIITKPMEAAIESGVPAGMRNVTTFRIVKDSWNNGLSREKIMEVALKQNSKCQPPRPEKELLEHVSYLLNNAERYLIKSEDDPFLIKNNFGATFENEEEKSIIIGDMLREPLPVIDYWINPLIPKGKMIIIGGRPSSWKSLFTLSLALAMARGEGDFLDEETFTITGKPKVLLYDLENGAVVIHDRINYLVETKELKKEELNNFHLREFFNKKNMRKELERAMQYDVIILDSYRRFLKGEENASEITDQFYNDFFKPLRAAGKTVIVIQHFRKSRPEEMTDEDFIDMFRGSSDLAAQVDLALALVKSPEEYKNQKLCFEVAVYKAKNRLGLPLRNFSFQVAKDDLLKCTNLHYLGEKKYEAPEMQRIKKLVEFLKSGEKKTKEIYEEFLGLSTVTVKRLLASAIVRGSVKSDKKGVYRLPTEKDSEINDFM